MVRSESIDIDVLLAAGIDEQHLLHTARQLHFLYT